jgi:hypothetical protein
MIKIKHTTIKPKKADIEMKDYIEKRHIKVKKMTLGEYNGDNNKAEGYLIRYPDKSGTWCEKDLFDKKVLEGIYKADCKSYSDQRGNIMDDKTIQPQGDIKLLKSEDGNFIDIIAHVDTKIGIITLKFKLDLRDIVSGYIQVLPMKDER